jgi:hypothetical protein
MTLIMTTICNILLLPLLRPIERVLLFKCDNFIVTEKFLFEKPQLGGIYITSKFALAF